MKAENRTNQDKDLALRIVISGVVQGVGFRPFIFRLASRFKVKGWVKNIGFGVELHLESEKKKDFAPFLKALKEEKPPLSQIEDIIIEPAPFLNLKEFSIEKSKQEETFVFISPDISTCENCRKELMSPPDRRYHYPFINCTDCGPRYSIVESLPYDRKKTTMAGFTMCQDCRREYEDPMDRRYHAQPVACPACGPQVELIEAKEAKKIKGGIDKAVSLIKEGKILAVKGLGGFHLVCHALNQESISRLRKIKQRKIKPLALMARDLKTLKKYARLSPAERTLLVSARRPIVLLRKKRELEGIAPFLSEMGFMLPYTPLHYLLLDDLELIVATSSNKKDAPIMKEEEEGIKELCDYILTHNRPIQIRADDSVLKIVAGQPLFLRRARGYVPYPQRVPKELEYPQSVLALGGELKDTISLYKNGYVITSQFLGDLDDYQNYKYFEETLRHLMRLFEVKPETVVSDLHPDFHTTRYAEKSGRRHFRIQHHFAHVLAPLLEHKIPPRKKVLGVALDGYGYGEDGLAWGGEFLLTDYSSYKRFAHFKYVPLPGGDLAAKQPWRMALSYLMASFGAEIPRVKALEKVEKKLIKGVMAMIEQEVNCPLTSSCGRLFDAVSFLVGLSPVEVEFEAEAPMRLEAVAAKAVKGDYGFSMEGFEPPFRVSFDQTLRLIVDDLMKKISPSYISARFHNTLAKVVVSVAEKARLKEGVDTVVLVGGVFLNKILLERAIFLLEKNGFNVLRSLNYSPNDESISIGQVAYALNRLKTEARDRHSKTG